MIFFTYEELVPYSTVLQWALAKLPRLFALLDNRGHNMQQNRKWVAHNTNK